MRRIARGLFVLVAGAALVLAGLAVAAGPASARPYCDGPNPPPICNPEPPVRIVVPDLAVAVSGPGTAVGGTTATYVITVTNPTARNAAAVSGVALSATLTGGASVAGVSGTGGFACQGIRGEPELFGWLVGDRGSATVTVQAALPSSSTTVMITATVDPGGRIAERNETNNSATLSTAVSAPVLPDLAITMTGPSTVRGVYAAGVWTMTITNQGAAPAPVVNVSWLTNWGGNINANAVKSGAIGFTCTPPPEYVQQLVYCYGTGTLLPGTSATIVITAVPPAPGNVYGAYGQSSVTATVDYNGQVAESNEGNNAATVNSTITA